MSSVSNDSNASDLNNPTLDQDGCHIANKMGNTSNNAMSADIDCRLPISHAMWPPNGAADDHKTRSDVSLDWSRNSQIPSAGHSPLEDGEIEDDDDLDDEKPNCPKEDVIVQSHDPVTDKGAQPLGRCRIDQSNLSNLKRSLPSVASEHIDCNQSDSEDTSSDFASSACKGQIRSALNGRHPSKLPRRSLSGNRVRYSTPSKTASSVSTDSADNPSGQNQSRGTGAPGRHSHWNSPAANEAFIDTTGNSDDHRHQVGGATKRHYGSGNRQQQRGNAGSSFRNSSNSSRNSGSASSVSGGRKPTPVCRYYLESRCNKGSECMFSHDAQPLKRYELCKFYLNGFCVKHNHCNFMHSEFPCKFFHGPQKKCGNTTAHCRFSHDPIVDPRIKEALDRVISEGSSDDICPVLPADKPRVDPLSLVGRQRTTDNQGPFKPSLLGSPPHQLKRTDVNSELPDAMEKEDSELDKSMLFKDSLSHNDPDATKTHHDKTSSEGIIKDVRSLHLKNQSACQPSLNIEIANTCQQPVPPYNYQHPQPNQFPPPPSQMQSLVIQQSMMSSNLTNNQMIRCNTLQHSPFPVFHDHDQRVCATRFESSPTPNQFQHHWHHATQPPMIHRNPEQTNQAFQQRFHLQQQRTFMHDADSRQGNRMPTIAQDTNSGMQTFRHPIRPPQFPIMNVQNRYVPYTPLQPQMHPDPSLIASLNQGVMPGAMHMCPSMRRQISCQTNCSSNLAQSREMASHYPNPSQMPDQSSGQYAESSNDDNVGFCLDNWAHVIDESSSHADSHQSTSETILRTLNEIGEAWKSAPPNTNEGDFISDLEMSASDDETMDSSDTQLEPVRTISDRNYEALQALVNGIRMQTDRIGITRPSRRQPNSGRTRSSQNDPSSLYRQLRKLTMAYRHSRRAANADMNDSPAEPSPPPCTRIRGFTGPFKYKLHRIDFDSHKNRRQMPQSIAMIEPSQPKAESDDFQNPSACETDDIPRDPRLNRCVPTEARDVASENERCPPLPQQEICFENSASYVVPVSELRIPSRPTDPRLAKYSRIDQFNGNDPC